MPRVEGSGHRDAIISSATGVILLSNAHHEIGLANSTIETLQEELYIDALTGIPNNESFNLKLSDAIKKADEGEGIHPTVFFIDIDNFKKVNDTLGHDIGDELLIKIANALQDIITVRGDEGECLARKSGDEFLAMIFAKNLSNARRDLKLTPDEIIEGIKKRWKDAVREIADGIGARYVDVTIGVYTHEHGEGLERVRSRADRDMLEQKDRKKKSLRWKTFFHRLIGDKTYTGLRL